MGFMKSPSLKGGRKPSQQRWPGFFGILLFVLILSSPLSADNTLPMHERIDVLLAEAQPDGTAALCTDGEFLRRAYLDFLGWLPSSTEARTFLADTSSDKRVKLIDRLLKDPQHAVHLATTLDVMLMERRVGKHTKPEDFRKWLLEEVKTQTPWDKLVAKLLAAEGADEKQRHVARWILDRDADPNALTRDTARLFLGMDVGCAQCHDHPRVADYTQRDYYALQAFFGRSYLFQPDEKKPAVVAERNEGESNWTSVFTKVSGTSRPGVFGGPSPQEPNLKPEEQWIVAPNEKDKMVRPVPKHSRRAQLAVQLTASPAFSRNLANRLWAMLMGRGLVEPVDWDHSANPPSSAKVLALLSEGVREHGFILDKTLREIALSRAYQRRGFLPSGVKSHSVEQLAILEADCRHCEATELAANESTREPRKSWEEKQKRAEAIAEEWKKAQTALAEPRKLVAAASKAQEDAEAKCKSQQELLAKSEDAIDQCIRAHEAVADAPQLLRTAEAMIPKLRPLRESLPALEKDLAAKRADLANKQQTLAKGDADAAKIKAREDAARAEAASALANLDAASTKAKVARESLKIAQRRLDAAKTVNEMEIAQRRAEEQAAKLAATKQTEDFVLVAFQKAEDVGQKLPKDEKLNKALAEAKLRRDQAATRLAEAEKAEADSVTTSHRAVESLSRRWSEVFALAPLTALSPDQFCWSLMRTTGVMEQLRSGASAEHDKKSPLSETDKKDPAKLAARDAAVESLFWEKIRGNENQFISLFGHGAGSPQSDFFATADQALFFENGGALRGWLNPSGENLTGRLMKLTDPKAIAEELYLSVLTREPEPEEVNDLANIMAASKPEAKAETLINLAWALMTSAEFRFKP